MNFWEAYQANKTRRTKLKDYLKWINVGAMEHMAFLPKEIEAQWEVEKTPEIYTVTCFWRKHNQVDNVIIYPGYEKENDKSNVEFEYIVGKRTKLTIEVLE